MMFPGCVENWTIIMDISEVGIFNFPLSVKIILRIYSIKINYY